MPSVGARTAAIAHLLPEEIHLCRGIVPAGAGAVDLFGTESALHFLVGLLCGDEPGVRIVILLLRDGLRGQKVFHALVVPLRIPEGRFRLDDILLA